MVFTVENPNVILSSILNKKGESKALYKIKDPLIHCLKVLGKE